MWAGHPSGRDSTEAGTDRCPLSPTKPPFPAPRTRPEGTLAGKVAELPSLEVETRQLGGSGQTGGCARLLRAHPSFVRHPPSPDAGETGTTSTFSTGGCTHNAVRQWEKRQPCQRLGDACEEFAIGKLHQFRQIHRGGVHAAEPDVGQGGRFDLLNGGGRKGGNALSQQPMLGRRILRTRLSGSLPVLRRVREFGSVVSAGAEKGAPS